MPKYYMDDFFLNKNLLSYESWNLYRILYLHTRMRKTENLSWNVWKTVEWKIIKIIVRLTA